MTATALKGEKERCLQAGMNEYIAKPFSATDLFNKLLSFLKQQPIAEEQAEAPLSAGLYDLSYLEELNDDAYLLDVLNTFLETAPATLNDIRAAIGREDWVTTNRLAHRIRSALGLMQMHSLLEIMTRIELNAKSGEELQRMGELIRKALQLFDHILPQLTAEKETIRLRLISAEQQ
jgi:HPt (histidine-containing phosphotransfer) domain-containing protein